MRVNFPPRLRGRCIVVTGGASGIGEATVALFREHGAEVAIFDRNTALAAEVAARLGAKSFAVDVTDENSVKIGIAAAASALGGIDGVVNSAGIVEIKKLEETSLAVWQRHLDINLTGTFLVCREAMPFLRKAEKASIVNIASGQAIHPVTHAPAYAASKAGVLALTKAIALEGAPSIRSNVVCPGLIDTPMHDPVVRGQTDKATVPLDNYPLRRWADPREVADAILYLTSDESSYVTGITLAVDGGRTFH